MKNFEKLLDRLDDPKYGECTDCEGFMQNVYRDNKFACPRCATRIDWSEKE